MNPLNYASFEASKRLLDAGVVLDTEASWCNYGDKWSIGYTGLIKDDPKKRPFIPAPSMAEVWRELPGTVMDNFYLEVSKNDKMTYASYVEYIVEYINEYDEHDEIDHGLKLNENPTDALVDLLIWAKGLKKQPKRWRRSGYK